MAKPTVGQSDWGTALNAHLDEMQASLDNKETPAGAQTKADTAKSEAISEAATSAAALYATKPDNGAQAVGQGELVVNVKDYGAVGNGVTDDRAAILAANTAVTAGGTVLFPPGTYLTDAAITLTKAVTWQGQGATIRKGSTTTVSGNFLVANVGGVHFRDLTFDDPNSKITGVLFSSGAAITGVTFDRCTFSVPAGIAVRLSRVTNGRVRDCSITSCRGGIRIENDANRILVSGVDISSWKENAVYLLGGTTAAPTNVTIDRVTITGFLPGGAASYPIHTAKSTSPTNLKNIAILGCTVIGPNKSFTAADPGTSDQISLHSVEDFRIEGCHSQGGGDMGITVDNSCKRGVIANNVCIDNDAAGIAIWTSVSGVAVTGNTCMNNGQNRNSDRFDYTRAGIRIFTASKVAISGNTLGDDQGTKTQRYGVSMTSSDSVSLGPDMDSGNSLAMYYKEGAANTNIVSATTAAF